MAGFLKCHGTGNLKGKLRRVNLVIGAVIQGDLDIHNGEACQHAG